MSKSLLVAPIVAVVITGLTIFYNIHIIEYQHIAANEDQSDDLDDR